MFCGGRYQLMNSKTIFITGGAAGIGLAIAKAFAIEEYQIALCDLPSEKFDKEVEQLLATGAKVVGISCDVSSEAQIIAAIEKTKTNFGRIDVLVNNAGLQYVAPIQNFPIDKFEQLLKVMLIGPFLAIKYVFPLMQEQKFGRIINMASINGLVGFAGKAAYNSAKHGVIGLTKVTALEGATHNITVNAICPGYVDTTLVKNQLHDLAKLRGVEVSQVLEEVIYPLVPTRRLIDVEEVVRYVLFLADERSASITGQAVVIDGGYTAQ